MACAEAERRQRRGDAGGWRLVVSNGVRNRVNSCASEWSQALPSASSGASRGHCLRHHGPLLIRRCTLGPSAGYPPAGRDHPRRCRLIELATDQLAKPDGVELATVVALGQPVPRRRQSGTGLGTELQVKRPCQSGPRAHWSRPKMVKFRRADSVRPPSKPSVSNSNDAAE
jgi:hypothetical protein